MSEPLKEWCLLVFRQLHSGEGQYPTGTRALNRCCLCLLKPGEDSRGLGGFSKGKVKNR